MEGSDRGFFEGERERLKKTTKISVRISCHPAEIRTECTVTTLPAWWILWGPMADFCEHGDELSSRI